MRYIKRACPRDCREGISRAVGEVPSDDNASMMED